MLKIDKNKSLDQPAYFNNRELSWLSFNKRVLDEAFDVNNPLIERLRFIAIFSSNLDEFFMVRVAGLKDQVRAGFNKPENKAGLTPKEQLKQIGEYNKTLVSSQYKIFKEIQNQLKKESINMLSIIELSVTELTCLEHYFDEQIFPVLTPLAIDAYRPFPIISNKSLNLAVVLQDTCDQETERHAIVQVPALLSRYIRIHSGHSYVALEEIISHFMYKLFNGYEVRSITEFRITRNADLTIHEEGARDLLKVIEKEIKKRKWGAAVRLEVRKEKYNANVVNFLLNVLEIHPNDLYLVDGPLDLTFLVDFIKTIQMDHEHLIYRTLMPQQPKDIHEDESVFEAALKRDIFLHHPYESFDPIVELLEGAADDPDVLAIKQTLYRVSGKSPIIKSLKLAAENGKQVTVLVELKARFDEEQNVQWAKELEKAGCHVIYGMHSLKTHSKITLIVRKRQGKIERFVHFGTGNYNDSTAKVYTDIGIITTKRKVGIDATNFFNYLSGYTERPKFHHLAMAPFDIRNDFIRYITEEIEFHKQKGNGHIIAKMNSLTDKILIEKLYKASQAGVQINLIVRGICCLKPGIKSVSENITVRSIVGRYLEHSRIFYFHSNGKERIFLSSADMMTRNMEKRIELLFPIYDERIKLRIKDVLELTLKDNVKAREQHANGVYDYVKRKPEERAISSQMELFKLAYEMRENK
ncbi:RNA degradosome polyphosphate kinase [Oceanobacillus alkalisoli]|uniref:RNA degradosome polyphosphate kinase n=1 Tax=Oceanobacillus alkalisoli TaxID=2925113 RepID=UPI001F121048|nr:RNA degradosome polyphosphate kinase [Oceanobacillus alkalisoli]MCF3944406.1 RNA degradosome polyphosphate kinase [Oceanobacillus alkalisoli]